MYIYCLRFLHNGNQVNLKFFRMEKKQHKKHFDSGKCRTDAFDFTGEARTMLTRIKFTTSDTVEKKTPLMSPKYLVCLTNLASKLNMEKDADFMNASCTNTLVTL